MDGLTSKGSDQQDRTTDLDLQRASDRIVVARHGPAGVVVNESMEVVQWRGDVSPYLAFPQGTVTLNAIPMAGEALGPALRAALTRSIAENIPVITEGIYVSGIESPTYVTVEVLPLHNLPAHPRHFLVLFVEQPVRSSGIASSRSQYALPAGISDGDGKERENAHLRQDLASTKTYLQSLIEERDVKNQEM